MLLRNRKIFNKQKIKVRKQYLNKRRKLPNKLMIDKKKNKAKLKMFLPKTLKELFQLHNSSSKKYSHRNHKKSQDKSSNIKKFNKPTSQQVKFFILVKIINVKMKKGRRSSNNSNNNSNSNLNSSSKRLFKEKK